MDFLLDHDVADQIGAALEPRGLRVVHIREVLAITTPDDEVLRFACEHGRVVITCNRMDFIRLAEARFAVGETIAGLIVVFRQHKTRSKVRNVLRLVENAGEEGILGNINCA
ncbi:MAG: DUF5615 family PIN-like protein [Chthoniobacteraceae bacterium]